MEIKLIKTFLTIVKLGSFHEAAKALQYSQPTITVQVKKLEDDLGMKLFERGKTTELTQAGQYFLQKAESLIINYEEFEDDLKMFKQGESGIIKIGISEPTASNRFSSITAQFHQVKPNIQLKVVESSNKNLATLLLNKEIDFALCNRPTPHINLNFEYLLTEQIGLLLPVDHPLVDKDSIRIKDLKDENMIVTGETCPFRIRIEEAFLKHTGERRKSKIEVTGINTLKYFVQSKLGITIAPLVAISPSISGTKVKKIEDMIEGPEVGLLFRRDVNYKEHSVQALLNEIRNYMKVDVPE